ncbi:hypothetical protein E6O75_ATG09348 [Venturia nashicola]|uniref:Uncharacterized protein n=1 Tax=Venturia nashicola TaxID=86259 RepID=A0A4Z1NI89_9PEZI|nr:hypothetical protein E6O75_ATG09348 [Venturia nashicola]
MEGQSRQNPRRAGEDWDEMEGLSVQGSGLSSATTAHATTAQTYCDTALPTPATSPNGEENPSSTFPQRTTLRKGADYSLGKHCPRQQLPKLQPISRVISARQLERADKQERDLPERIHTGFRSHRVLAPQSNHNTWDSMYRLSAEYESTNEIVASGTVAPRIASLASAFRPMKYSSCFFRAPRYRHQHVAGCAGMAEGKTHLIAHGKAKRSVLRGLMRPSTFPRTKHSSATVATPTV